MILKFLLIVGLVISSGTTVQTEAQEGKPIAEIPEMLKALKMAEEVATTSPNPFENLNQTEKMELASEEAEQQRIKALVSDSGLDEECLSQQGNIATQTHEMGYQFSREAGEVEQQIFRLIENMHKLPESKHEQIAINIAGLEKSLTELNKKKRDSYRQAEHIRSEMFTECRKSATQQSIRMVEVDDVGIYQSVEQDQPATDLSEQPTQQLSKFHKAALSGDTATISEILQIGTDVNEPDDFGRTALMYATSRDHGAVVALLLEANADPNIQADDGTTALYLAVKQGFVDTISLLMEADADILLKGPTGKTAVDVARETFGNYEVVKQKTKNFAVFSLVNGETLKQADARIKIEDYVAYTKASELGTVVAFEEYLYTYPEGLHAEQARSVLANLEDTGAYAQAKETGSIESYQRYLSSFPQGRYRDEIAGLLNAMQDDAAFAKASELGTVVAFEEYLSTYPEGLHVNNAIQLQEQARDKESFEIAKEIGLSAAFAKYLEAYPQGQFTEEAKQLASQAKDSEAFAKVKNIGSVEAYETYLSVYGAGHHAEDARVQIEQLKDNAAFAKATESDTLLAYAEYLLSFPNGLHAEQARSVLANMEDTGAYVQAKETGSIKSYQRYLSSFPQGRYKDEIASLLNTLQDDAAFAKASESGTVAAFEEYLFSFPDGLHAEQARSVLDNLEDTGAYVQAKETGSIESYQGYLSSFPQGRYKDEIASLLNTLQDDAAFAKASEAGTVAPLEEYLLSFPNGLHAEQARSVLDNLEDKGAYVQAKETGSIESYQGYLSSFPQGRYKDEIASLLNPLQDDAAFAKASEADTVAAFEEYLRSFPNGLHSEKAHSVLANLEDTGAYVQAKETGSIESYQGYLSSFPQGKYRDEIASLLTVQQEEFVYEKAEQSGSADGILEYLSAFPEGTHVKKALVLLEKIETRDITTQAEQVFEPRKIFQDCSECPQMIVVPAGEITIGSPQSEEARGENEGPQYPVNIRNSFAVGLYEVTHREFRTFIEQTGHRIENGCYSYNRKWRLDRDLNWQNPGFEKTDRSPIVCINWNDAKAYVNWLVEKTGRTYRLLSESEWEYVARAGTGTPFSTGATISTDQANYNGKYKYGYGKTGKDRKKATQVGSFSPNPFGLYDMHGNVYEWVEDCYNESYTNAPKDGRPWLKGNCDIRVLRGGSWNNAPALLRSSYRRAWHPSSLRYNNAGIRVARTLYTISGIEDRKLVQLCLDKQGYATGVPDGQFGIQARVAIRNWQEAQVKKGIPTEVTGYLTLFDVNAILENCKF